MGDFRQPTASSIVLATAVAIGLWALLTGAFASPAASQATSIRFDPVASGLDRPVDIQSAGDDRLFFVEQTGRIKVIERSDGAASQPVVYLDLSDQVVSVGEMGLLGLVFDPAFADNKHLYVNYTLGSPRRTRVSRFTEEAGSVDPTSELVILEFAQPQQNHNGGQLAFGPDGHLYIAVGDGGGGGDPSNQAQDPTSILGSILRIDVSDALGVGDGGLPPTCTNGPTDNYLSPADNPYVDIADACHEIWATGLRNPWRFAFDPSTDGVWVSDVGQDDREELNFLPFDQANGANYGWRCYEGTIPYNTDGCGPSADYIAPVFDYDQSDGNCSITGGVVYRGGDFPALDGAYFFADFCSDNYWTARETGAGVVVDRVSIDGATAEAPSAFGIDQHGEVYVASIGGTIYKLADTSSPPATQVTTAYSCLAKNGRIDITVANPADSETEYTLQVGSVPERRLTVPANTSQKVTITGRPDGPISVTILDGGAVVFEEVGSIQCDPEVDIRVSCLAGNGRLDIVLTNRDSASRQYAVTVGALAARLRQVGADDTATITVTGRRDGDLLVSVSRNGLGIAEEIVAVGCDPTPTGPVTISSSCLASNGRIDIDLVNDGPTAASYAVTVGALDRQRSLAAGGTGRITVTGRPDGPLDITVASSAIETVSRTVEVACDEPAN